MLDTWNIQQKCYWKQWKHSFLDVFYSVLFCLPRGFPWWSSALCSTVQRHETTCMTRMKRSSFEYLIIINFYFPVHHQSFLLLIDGLSLFPVFSFTFPSLQCFLLPYALWYPDSCIFPHIFTCETRWKHAHWYTKCCRMSALEIVLKKLSQISNPMCLKRLWYWEISQSVLVLHVNDTSNCSLKILGKRTQPNERMLNWIEDAQWKIIAEIS